MVEGLGGEVGGVVGECDGDDRGNGMVEEGGGTVLDSFGSFIKNCMNS